MQPRVVYLLKRLVLGKACFALPWVGNTSNTLGDQPSHYRLRNLALRREPPSLPPCELCFPRAAQRGVVSQESVSPRSVPEALGGCCSYGTSRSSGSCSYWYQSSWCWFCMNYRRNSLRPVGAISVRRWSCSQIPRKIGGHQDRRMPAERCS